MKPRELLLSSIFALVVAGLLTAQAPATPPAPKETKVAKEWTVLVSMEADNALEPLALAALQRLAQLTPGPTWTLVVEVVRPGVGARAPVAGMPGWTGTKRFQVIKGGLQEAAAPPPGLRPLTPEGLSNFVAWGTKTFPAKKTALFLWGHGGGRNGFGFSDTNQMTMTLADLKTGLSQGLGGTGAKRLDLVGFDAARMASYETAQALSPSARLLLACEGTGSASGWDWTALQVLTKTPAATGPQLGSALVAASPDVGHPLALVDLDKLGPIDAAFRSLEAAFAPRQAVLGTVVGLARNQCEPLGATGDQATDGQMVDLAALAARLKTNADLSGSAQALQTATESAILDGKSGLSLWFPAQSKTFAAADLSGEHAPWFRFLKAYFAGSVSTASAVVPVEQVSSGVAFLDGTVTISRLFDPVALGSATKVTLTYGTADTWSIPLFLGQRRAEFSEKAVSASWNLTCLSLSQGGLTVPAYATEDWVAENRAHYSVPLAYDSDGSARTDGGLGAVWLAVTVDLMRGQVVDQAWFEQKATGVVGPLVPRKEDRVAVLALNRSREGDWSLVERDGLIDPSLPVVCTLQTLAPTVKAVLSLDIGDDGGRWQGQEFIGSLTSASSFQIYRFFSR